MARYPEYRAEPPELRHQRARHAGRRDRGGGRHGRLRRDHRRRDRPPSSSRSISPASSRARPSPTSRRSGTRCISRRSTTAARAWCVNAISGVDLALWDLLGKLRKEPVLPAARRRRCATSCSSMPPARGPTSPSRWGSSAASCRCTTARPKGEEGLQQEPRACSPTCARRVGDDFWLMFDCWMSLDVDYATRLAQARARVWAEMDRGGAAARRLLGLCRAAAQRAARHAGHHRRARGDALGLPHAARDGLLRHHPARRRLVRRHHRAASRSRRWPMRMASWSCRTARRSTAIISSSRGITARSPSS